MIKHYIFIEQNYNLFKLQMQVHHSMTDYKSLIE